MAGQPATHLQVWHGGRFLGVSSNRSTHRVCSLSSVMRQKWGKAISITRQVSKWCCLIQSVCVLFRLYNHIQLSSNLMSGCDYSLFKVRLIRQLSQWQSRANLKRVNLCVCRTASSQCGRTRGTSAAGAGWSRSTSSRGGWTWTASGWKPYVCYWVRAVSKIALSPLCPNISMVDRKQSAARVTGSQSEQQHFWPSHLLLRY